MEETSKISQNYRDMDLMMKKYTVNFSLSCLILVRDDVNVSTHSYWLLCVSTLLLVVYYQWLCGVWPEIVHHKNKMCCHLNRRCCEVARPHNTPFRKKLAIIHEIQFVREKNIFERENRRNMLAQVENGEKWGEKFVWYPVSTRKNCPLKIQKFGENVS